MMKMSIKPVSALRDYNKLLKEVDSDNPVFLTKNGYGKYAIVDIESYDRFVNGMKVLKDLQEASAESGLYTLDDVFGELDK
ncbi:type II toxin-antitoxin system Phd/YefM family antitoxin [Limosilactobacillus walteri]|uniref:Type II toxin-antitoxin system Phd/YefM family antitoxin n=1 Tax=Limosilactobacillus walteri TaxID=2268022 RepID=A0ABR8P6A5_9LACO|nr:type II toxin-antitoxin system prevent-host-death family antitoxin [Limosilactobacillus walteri]MBD5806233.1 type II toxin-antitoxin system Phd/YefM family antitoxin [Limosilactobacillus walteri]